MDDIEFVQKVFEHARERAARANKNKVSNEDFGQAFVNEAYNIFVKEYLKTRNDNFKELAKFLKDKFNANVHS